MPFSLFAKPMSREDVMMSSLKERPKNIQVPTIKVSPRQKSVPESRNPFEQELIETARKIGTRGKGILAADESTGTIGKRFDDIGLENTAENRQAYRELLFTTPELDKYISGVIMYDETARDSCKDGTGFCKHLLSRGIVCGIKVDEGVKEIEGTNGETVTVGLDGLNKRCAEYYKMGIRFAKWRGVLKIGDG